VGGARRRGGGHGAGHVARGASVDVAVPGRPGAHATTAHARIRSPADGEDGCRGAGAFLAPSVAESTAIVLVPAARTPPTLFRIMAARPVCRARVVCEYEHIVTQTARPFQAFSLDPVTTG
jgi:hypothetical protein